MSTLVIGVVAMGFLVILAVGAGRGFDPVSIVLLAFIALFGGLSVAIARRAKSGVAGPVGCGECGGLLSPNAPYCKHCGAPRA